MRGTAGELGGRLVPGQVRRTIGTEDWVGTRSGERTEKRRDQWEGKIGAQDEVASGGVEGASHEVSRFQVNATQYEARAPKSDLGFVGISKVPKFVKFQLVQVFRDSANFPPWLFYKFHEIA